MKLEEIIDPSQLKGMTVKDLEALAQEIRREMIGKVSKTGGHLAPNLGVVELTLALHSVFNSPLDKIIWDVGHQSYVHKILTGRLSELHTLRQFDGLSGFPKRTESVHDVFETGHSSTSISAALGMAIGRDLQGESNQVIAVIGDGALTGGMAFEALNHAGHLGTNLIIILNDNEMSIAGNVGALSSYLSRIRTDPMYFKGKEEIENMLKRLPSIGNKVVRAVDRIKDSLKYLVVPGMLFEELGFTYLGPIDGHQVGIMLTVFNRAKRTKGPVLVHVVTKKGKGYKPAEENPDRFHGVGPFEVETGQVEAKEGPPSYTEVFGKSLVKLAEHNEKILGITAAMPDGTGLKYLAKSYPKRFFDVGIAEQHAITLAAGFAVKGFKPVVAIYSTFLQRGYDQVLHDVCLQKLPVVFALDRAGLVGEDGETHHGLFDLAFLRIIPNLCIMAPKNELELSQMLATALNQQGPVAIRYPRGKGTGVAMTGEFQNLPLGKSEILRRGEDVTIIGIGPIIYEALLAAETLAASGIECTVINARFVKPLDEISIVEEIQKNKRVVTLEEHVLSGGFGSSVLETVARHRLSGIEIINIGLPDEFVRHGKAGLLREKYGLTSEAIVQTIFQGFLWDRSQKRKNTKLFKINQ